MEPPSLPYERQYASIGRLIAIWSNFVENIEEAIDCLERNELAETKATPDRKVMQRFDHFMLIAADSPHTVAIKRLQKARAPIDKIKKLRDAFAHGSVVCWSEGSDLPEIMAFNKERRGNIRYTSSPAEIHQHCKLLSQASIDLHLAARRIAYSF